MSVDLLYWVWLAECLGPASRKLPGLLARFGSAYDIYRADDEELVGFDSDGNEGLLPLADKSLERACEIVEYCSRRDIGIITFASPEYPSRLKKLQDPPAVLYYRGKLPDFNNRLCIAVVGTRKMSEYGKLAAYKIAYELTAAGALVVSGMALGIDAMAGCGALSASGKTVAVFGCGVDRAYPSNHRRFMSHIIQNGCVISEYPHGTEPRGCHFPQRNRIISGLCQGCLVVEADASSGAIITAKSAILQGRDVFAVPGNIDSEGSVGTNELIYEGAIPARSAKDILENYRDLYSGVLSFKRLENSQRHSDFNSARAKFYGLDYAIEQNAEKSDKAKGLHPRETEVAAKDKAPEKSEKSEKSTPDASVINSLDEKSRRVYEVICANDAARLDDFVAAGVETGAAMSSLTLLEIRGLISQKPGGFYVKK